MVRVLYIMGTGRSGSTVLDSLLGNHEAMVTTGELSDLPLIGWVYGDYCACGVPASRCPFWTKVRIEWSRRTGGKDLVEDYCSCQTRFHRLRYLPRLLKEATLQSGHFKTYSRWTQVLFEIICELSGKQVVIDSSKSPARAFALSLNPALDVRLVHLVRDARGVAWSRKRTISKEELTPNAVPTQPSPIWRSAIQWMCVNLVSEWVGSRFPPGRSVRVRYEDFVTRPREVLSLIGHLCGLNLSALGRLCENGQAMNIGHIVSGNRVRMAGQVHLRQDTEWMNRMSAKERNTVWRLAGWLLQHYGYAREP